MSKASEFSFRGRLAALDAAGEDTAAIRKLINQEQKGEKRQRILLRMYGRYSMIRRQQEEMQLLNGEPLK
jgi:hypothetical protein